MIYKALGIAENINEFEMLCKQTLSPSSLHDLNITVASSFPEWSLAAVFSALTKF